MYLTDFQKKIVKKIAEGKVKTIKDFLSEFNLIQDVSKKTTNSQQKINIKISSYSYHFTDENSIDEKIVDFKKVIDLLEKSEIIKMEEYSDLTVQYNQSSRIFVKIFDLYKNQIIISYNEIHNFIKDFNTPQEKLIMRQLTYPIYIAIGTIVLSSILNYFIYTTDREVLIKNANAFNDTLYIKIINDSVLTINSNYNKIYDSDSLINK